MKTLKILVLVGMLGVTQSFAFSNTQRNILLGVGLGAIVAYTLDAKDTRHYIVPQERVVYVSHNYYKKRHHPRYRNKHRRHHSNYRRNSYREHCRY